MEQDEQTTNTDKVLYCFVSDLKHNTFESKTRKYSENKTKRTILFEFEFGSKFCHDQLLNLKLCFQGVEIMSVVFSNQDCITKKEDEKKDNRLKIEFPDVSAAIDATKGLCYTIMTFPRSNIILFFHESGSLVNRIVVECDLMRMSNILSTSEIRLTEPDLSNVTKLNINKRSKRILQKNQ